MLIRRNFIKQKLNDLIPLQQKNEQFDAQDTYPLLHFQPTPLNPEVPINSVLISSERKGNFINKIQKEDSQYSFKQKKILISEQPLVFDEDLPFKLNSKNVQQCQQFVKFQTKPLPQRVPDRQQKEKYIVKNKNMIGKLINSKMICENPHEKSEQHFTLPEQQSETVVKKHLFMSSTKMNETLNKIKSLKIASNQIEQTKSEPVPKTQQNQRYNKTLKSQFKYNESTDSSIEQATPIKKSMINNIRKHVERMSVSNKKAIPHQQQENEMHSIIFQLNSLQRRPKGQREEFLQTKNRSFLVRSTNKRVKKLQAQSQIITISYKTSILELKQLCIRYDQTMKVTIKIPQIFSKILFHQQDDEKDLFDKATNILKELSIYTNQIMTIRRYYNCVIVLIQDLAILSYFSGHIYFGGWNNNKNGLGFEWFPKKFVYYGQFKDNKREGHGILKDQKGNVLLGKWKENHYITNQ